MIKGLLLMLLLAAGAEAQDGALVARGQGVFKDQGCYGCHTVGKTGTPIATDLSRIGAKHDEAYLGRGCAIRRSRSRASTCRSSS